MMWLNTWSQSYNIGGVRKIWNNHNNRYSYSMSFLYRTYGEHMDIRIEILT